MTSRISEMQLVERPDKGQVVAVDVRLALGTVAEDGGSLPVGRHQKTDLDASKYPFANNWLLFRIKMPTP